MEKLIAIDTGFNYLDRDLYSSYAGNSLSRLKTDAWMFDNIIIPGIGDFLNTFPERFEFRKKSLSLSAQEYILYYFTNVQYLFDEGYILDPGFDVERLAANGAQLSKYVRKEPLYYFDLYEEEDDLKYVTRMAYIDAPNEFELVKHSFKILDNKQDTFIVGNPMLYFSEQKNDGDDVKNLQHILNVVLNDISIPSDDLTWEDILEIKSEKNIRDSFHKLRVWIKKNQILGLDKKDLLNEYYDLKNDYENYMHATSKKMNIGVIESLMTTTAEVIENTVKLKFKDLAGMPFALKNRKLQIDLEELKAPGREVGYIYKVSNRIEKRKY